MRKRLIIMPAYNELANLAHLWDRLGLLENQWDILIVDDGSTDETLEWLRRQNRVRYLSLAFNTGIGGAMQAGYRWAQARGYDCALQLDSDGQHPPEEAGKLLAEMESSGAALVIGSRFVEDMQYRQGRLRRIGIRIFSLMLSLMARSTLHDPTSGFRLADRETIALFAEDYPSDYPEVETLAQLLFMGRAVKEVAVHMHQRQEGVTSIHFWNSVYYMVKVPFSIMVKFIRLRLGGKNAAHPSCHACG